MCRVLLFVLVCLAALFATAPGVQACDQAAFFAGPQLIVAPSGLLFQTVGFGGPSLFVNGNCNSGFRQGFNQGFNQGLNRRFSQRPVPQTVIGAGIQARRDRLFGR